MSHLRAMAARPVNMPTIRANARTKVFSLICCSRHIRKAKKASRRRLVPFVPLLSVDVLIVDIIIKTRLSRLFAATVDYSVYRMQNYLEVGSERYIFYIEEVVVQALHHLIDVGSVSVAYHTPRRDAGPNLMQQ